MISNLAVGLPALAEQETWFVFSEWRSRGVPGGPENSILLIPALMDSALSIQLILNAFWWLGNLKIFDLQFSL